MFKRDMETIKLFIIHIIKNHFSKIVKWAFFESKIDFSISNMAIMTIINDFRKKSRIEKAYDSVIQVLLLGVLASAIVGVGGAREC